MAYPEAPLNGYFPQRVLKVFVDALVPVAVQPASQCFHGAVGFQTWFVGSAILATVQDSLPAHKLDYTQRTEHPLQAG